MRLTVDDAIAKAIDEQIPALALSIADKLRGQGCDYNTVVERVQKVRPAVTAAEWDALLYEAETKQYDSEK